MTEDRSKTLAKVMLNPGKPKSYDFFHIGSDVEVLFTYGYPIALRTGGDVYFPDLPYRKGEEKEGRLTQTTMRYINAFHPDLAHIRVSPREYDFIFASTMLSAFRPFIREA